MRLLLLATLILFGRAAWADCSQFDKAIGQNQRRLAAEQATGNTQMARSIQHTIDEFTFEKNTCLEQEAAKARQFERIKRESKERQQREAEEAAAASERARVRREAEQQQARVQAQQQEALVARHQARIDAVRADRKKMAIVFGGISCYIQAIRRDAQRRLTNERRYSAQAEVANLDLRDQLKTRLQWVDTREANYKNDLRKQHGMLPAPCGNPAVRKLVQCKTEGSASVACADDIGLYAEFIDDAPGVDEE